MGEFVYFTEEQKQRANAVDLEDFLSRQGEKLLRSGREKRLASDHSITVRGNRWYDHATEKGGCAIDFVRMFYNQSFPDAVTMLLGGEQGVAYRESVNQQLEPKKPFVLPEANQTMHRAFAYLIKTRCVDPKVVSDGIPRHAHKRGTCQKGQPFKGNVEGCDPRYSFRWIGKSNTVYVFEAPIDMLSFISMYQKGWMDHSYVALCGVAEHALMQLLNDAPHISQIALCLDHDKAGIQARERIKKNLSERGYHMVFSLFSNLKDWNEDLQELKKPPPEYMNRQQTVIQMM